MSQASSRRQFLKGAIGILGGTVAARIAGLFPEIQLQAIETTVSVTQLPTQLEVGELYAGFLLLSDGLPIPAFVVYPQLGPPVICGAGQANPELTGYGTLYSTPEDVATTADLPIYSLDGLPAELRSRGGNVIRYNTGEVYAVSVDFELFNTEVGLWETVISIWAQPNFPRPYPLWSSEPVEPDGPAVVLEKVSLLPTPGIRTRTQHGDVFYWIQNDILFTLIQETGYIDSQETLGSLVPTS